MPITSESESVEFGAKIADLPSWAAGISSLSDLSVAYDKLTENVAEYSKATVESAKSTEKMVSSTEMLSGVLLGAATSFESLIQASGTMALMAAGLPAPLAAVEGKLLGLAKNCSVAGYALELVSKRLGQLKKVAVWTGKVALSAFKKLATLGVAALKKLAKFGIEAFKKLARAAVALAKKILNALKNLAIGVAAFVAGLVALPVALDKLFQKVMVDAARLEGIRAAFFATGEGAGAMFSALKEGSSGMIEDITLMEKYNFALLLVGKTMADELPEALIYLTKIALATGEDINYLFDSLVRGVGRLSPRILDNLAIQVSLAEAVAWATAEYGKQSDQLTIAERQAGMMAVAMEKLEAKTAGLGDATTTLTYLMAKYKVTMAENARLLATIFLPVAKSFYTVMNKLGEMFKASISEGGKYYNVLRKLSAGFAGLADAIGEVVGRFATGGSEAVDAFADKMFEAAWDAFSWGMNIINNLAIGMARGIATTLITVINQLSNFLSYWLSPGSAPKIVPNLLAWGASVFTEYLRGFALANFGILTGVQAPLEGALRNLVALGTISSEEAGAMFINLSEAMAQAIATGDITAALEGLVAVGGEYGAELEELFKRQMAVAAATKAVEEAERRLVAAREREEKTGKALSKQAREYNRLLREGATQAELAAKLAQVKASYTSLVDAREETELAEEAKIAAEERAKATKELMQIQNALLQQLIKMGQIWGGMGDGDGDLLPDLEDIESPFDSMIVDVDQAFEDLKNSIRDKFLALWGQIVEGWNESGIRQLIEDLKRKWEESDLKAWWFEFIFAVDKIGLEGALHALWLKLVKTTQAFLDDKSPAWGNIWRAFTQEGIDDGSGRVAFGDALTVLWIEFAIATSNWLAGHLPWLGNVWTAFTQGGVEDGSGAVDFTSAFAALWEEFKNGIILLAGKFGAKLGYEIGLKLFGFYDETQEAHDGAEAGSFWERLGMGFVTGLVAGFGMALVDAYATLQNYMTNLFAIFTTFFGTSSPSTKFAGLGRDLINGLKDGMSSQIGFVNWFSMGSRIKNAIAGGLAGLGGAIKNTMNSVIRTIESAINNIISGINNLIYVIGVATGAWASYVNYVSLPRLAEGGLIQATEQLAVLHKHEVVLPLGDPKTVDLMADAMRGAFGQIQQADAAPAAQYKIDLHFGRDSVRSDRDIMMIADQVQRALELRGVRGGLM